MKISLQSRRHNKTLDTNHVIVFNIALNEQLNNYLKLDGIKTV